MWRVYVMIKNIKCTLKQQTMFNSGKLYKILSIVLPLYLMQYCIINYYDYFFTLAVCTRTVYLPQELPKTIRNISLPLLVLFYWHLLNVQQLLLISNQKPTPSEHGVKKAVTLRIATISPPITKFKYFSWEMYFWYCILMKGHVKLALFPIQKYPNPYRHSYTFLRKYVK